MRRPSMILTARNRVLWMGLLSVLGISVALAMIVLSPMLVLWQVGWPISWAQAADVGQAYGGASAVLAGIALCGVAASLVVQRRQIHIDQLHTERQRHFDLMRLALENPKFLQAVDPRIAADPDGPLHIYANLMVGYWLAGWEVGQINDEDLRTNLRMMFVSPVARDWWTISGGLWLTRPSGRQRYFLEIVREEYRLGLLAGASAASPRPSTSPDTRFSSSRTLLPCSLGKVTFRVALGGLAIASAIMAVRRHQRVAKR